MAMSEDEKACREKILSEDYLDLIFEYRTEIEEGGEKFSGYCVEIVDDLYAIAHISAEDLPPYSVSAYGFRTIPSLFSLQDTGSMAVSGILRAQNQPLPDLRGQGILIGFIDTGIDYTHQAFRDPDGNTRILSIWDQTIQSENPPEGLLYGTEYTGEQINEALRTADPFALVPTRDEDGHGTFTAGIAAGSETADGSFIGAAPEAYLAVVKLKTAKQRLRDYYFLPEDTAVYQETDIMMSVRFLLNLQRKRRLPMVLCLGLGTNTGGHDGSAPLEEVLTRMTSFRNSIPVVATGNDGNEAHHYHGRIGAEEEYQDVEIRVPDGSAGFRMEFWGRMLETYSIAVISPSGESVPPLPPRNGRSEVFRFVLEPTVVTVDYSLAITRSGSQLISLGFEKPTAGIWRLRVFNTARTRGEYHMWLPIAAQVEEGTEFLRPDPEVTLAIPATSAGAITTGGYNHRNDSFYIASGRGYTRTGVIKPALASPCVDVDGPLPGGRYGRRTGTSVAAAHLAGAVADLLGWGLAQDNARGMDSNVARAYLIRGARRLDGVFYPNPETGYGLLDLYGIFQKLISY